MGMINTKGYFKGVIEDNGLGQSSGGFPQEVLALRATEVWDSEGQEYLPVDAEHDEITAYLILIDSKDKETKNCEQLKKVTGWDGASLVDLSEMDMADTPLSFRVEENTYEGNTSLQVRWIDVPDATPGRQVQKLAKEDVLALQARYAGTLAASAAPPKPVSAKDKKEGKKPAAPKPPKKAKPAGKCTADEAYDACYGLKRDDVTEKQLNDLWRKEADAINEDETKITDAEWFQIKENILKQIGKV